MISFKHSTMGAIVVVGVAAFLAASAWSPKTAALREIQPPICESELVVHHDVCDTPCGYCTQCVLDTCYQNGVKVSQHEWGCEEIWC